jgi:hypothetical protein
MSIGICYPDKYAVEETFQLLKVPWEWYRAGRQYDVVLARRGDVPEYSGNLIDLTGNDFFQIISVLLNTGQPHLHEPRCDVLLDTLRAELRKYTILVEIPPSPWGHPYAVALTHDVDVTSVRECRLRTVGYAAIRCVTQGNIRIGLQLLSAWCGLGADPWELFERWKLFEEQLSVRSTFFFVPFRYDPGVRAHPYRAVGYDVKTDVMQDLIKNGWEAGVHGIDNWIDAQRGKQEIAALGLEDKTPGNRTHWLLFHSGSWNKLDEAGYLYDTTFGYNDDVGFRAGTLQVYRPRSARTLLELPLHIQDLGLFGTFCWAPVGNGWEKTPCLHLDTPEALCTCNRILDFANKYGGAVTILWHYENITPPCDWSAEYSSLVNRAKTDGAWVTKAMDVVSWFRARRETKIECSVNQKMVTITIRDYDFDLKPPQKVRIHIEPSSVSCIGSGYIPGEHFVDIRCDRPQISLVLL